MTLVGLRLGINAVPSVLGAGFNWAQGSKGREMAELLSQQLLQR